MKFDHSCRHQLIFLSEILHQIFLNFFPKFNTDFFPSYFEFPKFVWLFWKLESYCFRNCKELLFRVKIWNITRVSIFRYKILVLGIWVLGPFFGAETPCKGRPKQNFVIFMKLVHKCSKSTKYANFKVKLLVGISFENYVFGHNAESWDAMQNSL